MKKLKYVAIGVLLGISAAVLYNRNQSPGVVQKTAVTALAVKSAKSTADIVVPTVTIPAVPTQTANQSRNGAYAIVNSRGAVADFALVRLAYKHPELKLTPEVAADLQEIFSANYMLYAGYQAKIARAVEQSDGSVLIQIPAFPAQGEQLLNNLMADLSSYYHGNIPAGVAEAMMEQYRGFTNSAGQIPVNLTVRVSSDPTYMYGVIRETIFLDSATGKVTGHGSSNDVLTKDQLLYSPYSELSKFFPKAPKG